MTFAPPSSQSLESASVGSEDTFLLVSYNFKSRQADVISHVKNCERVTICDRHVARAPRYGKGTVTFSVGRANTLISDSVDVVISDDIINSEDSPLFVILDRCRDVRIGNSLGKNINYLKSSDKYVEIVLINCENVHIGDTQIEGNKAIPQSLRYLENKSFRIACIQTDLDFSYTPSNVELQEATVDQIFEIYKGINLRELTGECFDNNVTDLQVYEEDLMCMVTSKVPQTTETNSFFKTDDTLPNENVDEEFDTNEEQQASTENDMPDILNLNITNLPNPQRSIDSGFSFSTIPKEVQPESERSISYNKTIPTFIKDNDTMEYQRSEDSNPGESDANAPMILSYSRSTNVPSQGNKNKTQNSNAAKGGSSTEHDGASHSSHGTSSTPGGASNLPRYGYERPAEAVPSNSSHRRSLPRDPPSRHSQPLNNIYRGGYESYERARKKFSEALRSVDVDGLVGFYDDLTSGKIAVMVYEKKEHEAVQLLKEKVPSYVWDNHVRVDLQPFSSLGLGGPSF